MKFSQTEVRPFFNTPSLLIWDPYGSHEKEEIKAHLRGKYRSENVSDTKEKDIFCSAAGC